MTMMMTMVISANAGYPGFGWHPLKKTSTVPNPPNSTLCLEQAE
jgi:hypothetical protein